MLFYCWASVVFTEIEGSLKEPQATAVDTMFQYKPYSAGIDFRRQNLASINVRF